VTDLKLLRQSGIESSVKAAAERGIPVIGVCGGYQMLGNKILDPHNVESEDPEVEGMGLLDTVTTLDRTKTTCQVTAKLVSMKWFAAIKSESTCRWNQLKGYEIHMGNTTGDTGLFQVKRLNGQQDTVSDGSAKGNVAGTYMHGIFDNDGIRTDMLNSLRKNKGLAERSTVSYQAVREEAMNRWADVLGKSVDICFILRLVDMELCMKRVQGENI
jgi:adenosylcobyric acid synthase